MGRDAEQLGQLTEERVARGKRVPEEKGYGLIPQDPKYQLELQPLYPVPESRMQKGINTACHWPSKKSLRSYHTTLLLTSH